MLHLTYYQCARVQRPSVASRSRCGPNLWQICPCTARDWQLEPVIIILVRKRRTETPLETEVTSVEGTADGRGSTVLEDELTD